MNYIKNLKLSFYKDSPPKEDKQSINKYNVSVFYNQKILFGGYPTQTMVNKLEKDLSVKWFVDLTTDHEIREKYKCVSSKYMSYPIEDRKIPVDYTTFKSFIAELSTVIQNMEDTDRMYIHCRGGHGRSGMVAAVLLCILEDINSETSIVKITQSHKNRPNLSKKWVRSFCPNDKEQRDFIREFTQSLIN